MRFVLPFLVVRGDRRGLPTFGALIPLLLSLALVLVPGVASADASGSGAAPLASRLDRLAKRGPLAKASLGIYVERARDGAVVYARGADQLLIPASNQKILTALSALHRFGPSHRFATRVWAPAAPDAEGVVKALLVEGGGDPAINSEDWWRLAADLRREGLRGVEGDLRVDDTLFEGPGWHPSWGRVSTRAYHAPVGALTANYGSFFVSVWPQKTVGSAARVYVDPPVDYLLLRNRAKTVARSARPRLVVSRVADGQGEGDALPAREIVSVEGGTRQGSDGDLLPRSVVDPGLYAGSVLALQLEANGVYLDGDVRRAPRGDESMVMLLEHEGRSVAQIVGLCMKYSNNSIAETLVKNLGAYAGADTAGPPARQGDWVSGIRAMREELVQLGVELDAATLVDGSGLSLQNRVSPRALVQALRAGRSSFKVGPEFVAALPIAERDGTLERRLWGGADRIRAKTGLLADAAVMALSGYAERSDGETLIFSIMVNGHTGGTGEAMDAVDAIARALLDAPLDPALAGR